MTFEHFAYSMERHPLLAAFIHECDFPSKASALILPADRQELYTEFKTLGQLLGTLLRQYPCLVVA